MQQYRETAEIVNRPASSTPGAFAEQVAVILAQALIGGLLIGAAGGLVAWLAIVEDGRVAVKTGGILAVLVAAGLYVALLADARGLLRVHVEPVAWEQEPPAPLPAKSERPVILVNAPSPGQVAKRADLERRARFRRFVEACGVNPSRRALLAAGFGEGEVGEFVAILRRLGLTRDRGADPRAGWELAKPVAEIVARLGLR